MKRGRDLEEGRGLRRRERTYAAFLPFCGVHCVSPCCLCTGLLLLTQTSKVHMLGADRPLVRTDEAGLRLFELKDRLLPLC